MPVIKCSGSPERWRIGAGDCMYTSYASALKAYQGYLAKNPRDAKEPISFDYDGVLTSVRYQNLARFYIQQGKAVYILTDRSRAIGNPVLELADKIGVSRNNVIFTAGRDKLAYVREKRIKTFYDNNPDEVNKVNSQTEYTGILV